MKKALLMTALFAGIAVQPACGNADQEAKDKAAADSLNKVAAKLDSTSNELDRVKSGLEEKTQSTKDSVDALLKGI